MKIKVEKIAKGKWVEIEAELIRPLRSKSKPLSEAFNQLSQGTDLYLYDKKGILKQYSFDKPSQLNLSI